MEDHINRKFAVVADLIIKLEQRVAELETLAVTLVQKREENEQVKPPISHR